MRKVILYATIVWVFFSCGDDGDPITELPDFPPEFSEVTVSMQFSQSDSTAPYNNQQPVDFTFAASGSLLIDTNPDAADGNELELTDVLGQGTGLTWRDTLSGYNYIVSFNIADTTLNEIRLTRIQDNVLMGIFNMLEDLGEDLQPADPADLPSVVRGVKANMELTLSNVDDIPYVLNQKVDFTFSDLGGLAIDVDPEAVNGDEIEIPVFYITPNGEFVWIDEPAGYFYALSIISEKISEINLIASADSSFLGQFTEVESGGSTALDLVKAFQGTYNVTSVDNGAHNRNTVVIDAEGNIDFDTDKNFTVDTYELITDRVECCEGIWIDLAPYPSEPYPRLELYVDTDGLLTEINHYPEYPNASGRVDVKLVEDGSGTEGYGQLTITGDNQGVGGMTFSPDQGQLCGSCSVTRVTWVQNFDDDPDIVLFIEGNPAGNILVEISQGSAFAAFGSAADIGLAWDETAKTVTFTNTAMNEKFSQPGEITISGTLLYE